MSRLWLNTFIIIGACAGSVANAACYVAPVGNGTCSFEFAKNADGQRIQDDICNAQGEPTGQKEDRMVCKPIVSTNVVADPTYQAWLDRMPTCKTVNSRGKRNKSCERNFLAWQNAQPKPGSTGGGSNNNNGNNDNGNGTDDNISGNGNTGSVGSTQNSGNANYGNVVYNPALIGTENVSTVTVPTYQVGPSGQVDYQPPSYRRTFSY